MRGSLGAGRAPSLLAASTTSGPDVRSRHFSARPHRAPRRAAQRSGAAQRSAAQRPVHIING